MAAAEVGIDIGPELCEAEKCCKSQRSVGANHRGQHQRSSTAAVQRCRACGRRRVMRPIHQHLPQHPISSPPAYETVHCGWAGGPCKQGLWQWRLTVLSRAGPEAGPEATGRTGALIHSRRPGHRAEPIPSAIAVSVSSPATHREPCTSPSGRVRGGGGLRRSSRSSWTASAAFARWNSPCR